MVDDGANWRIIVPRAVLALIAVACPFAWFAGTAVQAQGIMRTPSLNVAPRLPRINPSVGTRVNPTITGKTVSIGKTTSIRSVPRIGVRSTLPYVRYSPNIYPPCGDGYRDGGCWDQSGSSAGGGVAAALRRPKAPITSRAVTFRTRRSTCAPSPTNSWPRSTARYPTRRPMNWRGVTASSACNRRISL